MTITTEQDQFIQSHEGELNPQQAAQLLEMGLQGDTGAASPDNEAAPSASPAQKSGAATNSDGAAAADGQNGDAVDPDNAVILARDGKHTISYHKLVEARNGERHWKAEAEAQREAAQTAQRELEAHRSQAQARADAGEAPTAADNALATAEAAMADGVDPDLFGDFSEEALTAGIQKLVETRVSAAVAKVEARLEPIQQKQQSDATQAHYSAIYTRHPDADSIVESQEFEDWIAAQPSFARAGFVAVLQKGSTADVIELFDTFKEATVVKTATGSQPPAPSAADLKAAAKAAITNAQPAVPNSLADFPGGNAGAGSRDEAMAAMEGKDLLDAMQAMSPEQIEKFLNRQI